jgi:hypothetical protein
MVTHTCGRARQENWKFQVILGCIVRPCLKNKDNSKNKIKIKTSDFSPSRCNAMCNSQMEYTCPHLTENFKN